MEPIADNVHLPRVLLIGDSISIGYTLPTREALRGVANVHRIPENGGPTTNGVAKIEQWLQNGPWDVIHFNWGLHDLKRMPPDNKQQVSIDDYEKHLGTLVARMRRTGARLIWATTTPVPKGELAPPRSNDDVLAYNAAAAERVMKANNVAINDLYNGVLPTLSEHQLPVNVHFSDAGSVFLGQLTANSIKKALASPAPAAEKPIGFIRREHKAGDESRAYTLFVPPSYDPAKAWPLVVFLHGAGERGDDGRAPSLVGLGPAIRKRFDQYPALAVFPQCALRQSPVRGGWSAEGPDARNALKLIEELRGEFNIDPDRLYLTGLSMGGYGTWSLAQAKPTMWAAIAPVCGGGDPSKVNAIAKLPNWCFHGDQDRAVRVEESRVMIEALRKIGATPKYTEYAGVAHNCWDAAYGTMEFHDWLFAQRRGAAAPKR